MTVLAFDNPALNALTAPAHSPLSQALIVLAVTVATWETRARTRAALRDLPVERYGDLGLTTAEILHEVAKPFWRA